MNGSEKDLRNKDSAKSYAKVARDNEFQENNKLKIVPTSLNELGEEVVVFGQIRKMWARYGFKEIIYNGNGRWLFKFSREEGLSEPKIMDSMTTYVCKNGMGITEFARVLVEIEAAKGFNNEVEIQCRDKNQVSKDFLRARCFSLKKVTSSLLSLLEVVQPSSPKLIKFKSAALVESSHLKLLARSCPRLQRLSLERRDPVPPGVDADIHCIEIENLSLNGCVGVSAEVLPYFNELVNLELVNCPNISWEDVKKAASSLEALECLVLDRGMRNPMPPAGLEQKIWFVEWQSVRVTWK
nr:hypothetical protein [Tanacetum cinerariifolium]